MRRLLLDTHYVLMLAGSVRGLNSQEARALSNPEHSLVVSDVSLWEIALKWRSRYCRVQGKEGMAPTHVITMLQGAQFDWLTIKQAHVISAPSVPIVHNDPFDELLISQVEHENLRLLTRDTQLLRHPLAISAADVLT